MKIPKSLKVGGHKIAVEKVNTKDIESGGEYNYYYNLIRIRIDDCPESSISECFLHEIIECIKVRNQLNIDHTHLTVLSEGLFQVIRDNELNFSK